jgi:uncharacterized protein (DUF2336 family)
MEAALTKLLVMFATHGPGFLVAAIFIALFFVDRRSSKKQIASERAENKEAVRETKAACAEEVSNTRAACLKEVTDERNRNDKLSEKLLSVFRESIRSDEQLAKAIAILERSIDRRSNGR